MRIKWNIKLYYDDKKTNLLFEKDFESVAEIHRQGFKLKRDLLYDFTRKIEEGCLKKDSKKKKCLEKYKRLIITKYYYNKKELIKTSILNI